MSEHPFDEIERMGSTSTPPVDPAFADRLEAELRVRHATSAPGRRVPEEPPPNGERPADYRLLFRR